MFHALRAAAIDTDGLTFTHQRDHTAALNRLAIGGGTDVVAVSLGRLPGHRRRAISCCRTARPWGGATVRWSWRRARWRPPTWPGCGSGSRARAPRPGWCCASSRRGAIGVEIPIAPFNRIFDALAAGEVDAALLIHEGRLLYPTAACTW